MQIAINSGSVFLLDFYKRYYPEVSFQFIFPCYNMLVSSKNVEKDHPLTKKGRVFTLPFLLHISFLAMHPFHASVSSLYP